MYQYSKGVILLGRKSKVSPELKIAAVKEYLSGKASQRNIANKYGIDNSSFGMWIRNYQALGEDAFFNPHNKYYSAELKEAAVKDYLAGKGPLTPLTMNEIADQLSIHPSTVSRAVRGKTIQYPGGTIPFRSLFRAAALKSSEAAVDSGSVKDRIRDLIAGENKKKPLSDEALSKVLKGEGIRISRRTVAAYREEMNIPSSFNRKM